MRNLRLPHPLPYQGSKRKLAPQIGEYLPSGINTWYEPFAGSIAMTIFAASRDLAKKYVIGDSLESISKLWEMIIETPMLVSEQYEDIWYGQKQGGLGYFNSVRDRYNQDKNPVDLLYLTCRCVKNSVRFNKHGYFTQSADKRRLGMHPVRMTVAVGHVSDLLKGRTEVRYGDWMDTAKDASRFDYMYLDPPYFGTTEGRDKRYSQQLKRKNLIESLEHLIDQSIPFSLSYDGMTGDKEYCPPLPSHLGMTRILLHAGVSSQATLLGRYEETVESLYIWPSRLDKVSQQTVRNNSANRVQFSLAL